MTAFRPTRRPRGEDPFLRHKMLLFVLGAGLAIAGIGADATWLISLGIAVLAAGFVVRVIGERRRRSEEDEQPETDA